MKVIYEFNIPGDEHEFRIQSQANEMHNALFEIKNNLRSRWKDREEPPTEEEIFEAIHELTKDIKCLE